MWGAQNSANYLYKKLLDEVNCSFKPIVHKQLPKI